MVKLVPVMVLEAAFAKGDPLIRTRTFINIERVVKAIPRPEGGAYLFIDEGDADGASVVRIEEDIIWFAGAAAQ